MTMIDRLSTMPDEVLYHILSFLPTQDVIATSLLSKRWKHLWHSVPTLHFDDESYYLKNNDKPYSRFVKFVYAGLLSCPGQQLLKTFRLKCVNYEQDDNLSISDLMIWVNTAIQCGAEHLDLCLPLPLDMLFSCFSYRTLVVLKLNVSYVYSLSSVYLPSLKTLHLDDVDMYYSQNILELLNGCPILEDLRANNVYYENESTVGELKDLPKLVSAVISDIVGYEILPMATSNAEFWRLKKPDHDVPLFPNLIHLVLYFSVVLMTLVLYLKCLGKLQSFVVLQRPPFKSSLEEIWPCPQFVPECISLQLRRCTLLNYRGDKCEQEFAKYIMQNSRALRTMTICNFPSSSLQYKYEMLQELAMCPRSSTTCKLLFK